MIKVYDSTEKLFNHNGIKILKPLKCIVTKEDNGDYYLEIEDSIDNLDFYQANMLVTCPTPFPEGVQIFRLKNPSKNSSKITVKAKHIYFDRANYIIDDRYIVNKNCGYALDYLNSNTDIKSPFKTSSNIETNNSYRVVRKSLVEADNEIINRWNGHLVRDNFNVSINSTIGADRGITLKYAKNISNMKSEENWDNVVTKILPVGKDGILLPELYIELDEQLYDIPFTKVVSFSQDIEQQENQTDEEYKNILIDNLRNQAISFLNENKNPKVNYSLSAHLDNITDVGDTIYVEHPKLKLALTTNVISVKWDAISKKYKTIEFGNFKNSLKNLIKNINTSVETIAQNISNDTKTILENELLQATSKIWNQLGCSYIIYEGDKILVVDTLPKENATNVMMINSGGIGFSTTGINGTFNSAWTIDGTLDMQNINVINLVADMIKGGTLKLGNVNNTNGTLEIYDANNNLIGKIDKDGFFVTINGKSNNVSNTLSELTQSINEIKSQISEVVDLTISSEGHGSIFLENIAESEPIYIKIQPTKDNDISYLYPSDNLYPSDDLYSTNRVIEFKSSDSTIYYELPDNLLYYDSNNYDEFILDYNSRTCLINKKVEYNADGSKYLLENPKTISYSYPTIHLDANDYIVSLPGNSNSYLFVRLMVQNIYTNQLATKMELKSSINQTKEEIGLEVSKKVDKNETVAQFKLMSDNINSKVSKNGVISSINQSSEKIIIDANKVDINGVVGFINNESTTTINGNKITTGTINTNQIASNAITADKIKANSITADQVASDIITTKNFSAQNINANNIKSGTLSADRINGGTITGSAINLGNGKFVVNTNGILSCTGANFNGSINGSAIKGSSISGGSINIDSGTGYYFNMGLTTDNPSCSGLNVGWSGIHFVGGKGINNTDGYNFNFSSGCLYAVEKVQSVKGANITFGNNIGIYGGYIYCEVEKLEFSGGLWLNTNGTIGRSGNITINSSSSIDLLGGTYGVYASRNGSSTSAIKTDAGSYSSRIVKKNIKKFTKKKYDDSLELLDSLDLYSYDYKYNLYENKSKYGFIIDELEQNELSKEFFDFYEKEAIVNGKELDFNLTHKKGTDKTIKLKNYDSDVLDKYLLTCVKALYNKFKNMEVLTNGK